MSAEKTTVPLSKPIVHGDDEITEISLREMTAADISKCGYPVQILAGGSSKPDGESIAALIARLGSLPPSVVGKLCARDYNACMGVVMGFLGEGEAA